MSWKSAYYRLSVMAVAASLSYARGSAQQTDFPTINVLPPAELSEVTRDLLPQGFHLRPVYQKGITLTKSSEGWVPHLYNDAVKYCTIGYGHLIRKAPCNGTEPTQFRNGLTRPQGVKLLVGDMSSSQYTVMTGVKVKLTNGQFAALTDFVFNVGSGNFRNSSLLRVVNAGELDSVPAQFRRWVVADGKTLPALAQRREREINLFFDGLPRSRDIAPLGEKLEPIDIRKGE